MSYSYAFLNALDKAFYSEYVANMAICKQLFIASDSNLDQSATILIKKLTVCHLLRCLGQSAPIIPAISRLISRCLTQRPARPLILVSALSVDKVVPI